MIDFFTPLERDISSNEWEGLPDMSAEEKSRIISDIEDGDSLYVEIANNANGFTNGLRQSIEAMMGYPNPIRVVANQVKSGAFSFFTNEALVQAPLYNDLTSISPHLGNLLIRKKAEEAVPEATGGLLQLGQKFGFTVGTEEGKGTVVAAINNIVHGATECGRGVTLSVNNIDRIFPMENGAVIIPLDTMNGLPRCSQ